jgi:DNA-directed RNA polymerase specialized sigma24 family protein
MADNAVTFSCFPTTQWSQIIEVIQQGDSPTAEAALAEFCQQYRPAIYNFFRRQGSNHAEAEDLTQSFFHKRILHGWADREGILYSVQRQPGRNFRAYLAESLKHFRTEQWRRENSIKAGGGIPHEPLTSTGPAAASPEAGGREFGRAFDQSFAIDAIKNAAGRATRSHAFLNYFLRREQDGEEIAQTEAARELDMSVGAFKRGYHAFRARLKDELWREVAKYTGPGEQEIEAEMAYLISLFPDSLP